MTSGIYIMTNKSNGNRYVGYSENIEVRYAENIRQLKEGTFGKKFESLVRDFETFGENAFICGVLEVTANDSSLMEKRSKYWKDLIQSEYNQHSN